MHNDDFGPRPSISPVAEFMRLTNKFPPSQNSAPTVSAKPAETSSPVYDPYQKLDDMKFQVKYGFRPIFKVIETAIASSQNAPLPTTNRALVRALLVRNFNNGLAKSLGQLNDTLGVVQKSFDVIKAVGESGEDIYAQGGSVDSILSASGNFTQMYSNWVISDTLKPVVAEKLITIIGMSEAAAVLGAFIIAPIAIDLTKKYIIPTAFDLGLKHILPYVDRLDLATGPQLYRPYYRPYVPKGWPIQHVPIHSIPQPYRPINKLPSIEAAPSNTPPDIQPEPANPSPITPAQPININIPEFFNQMLQSIYPPTQQSTTNDNNVISDDHTTRNPSGRSRAQQDPYTKPPKADPLFVIKVNNDSDNIQLPPMPTPPNEVLVRRPNESSVNKNTVTQVATPNSVTRDDKNTTIEIGLGNISYKTPNSETTLSANPLEAFNFFAQTIKYLSHREPQPPSFPNNPELNKLDQLYSDFVNAKPKHKETTAGKVLDEIRGLNQKYPEQQLHLNALEWAVNEQRNNPSQSNTVPTDTISIGKAYLKKATDYVQGIGNSIVSFDHQKAVEIERANKSLPSDFTKIFEPFVKLLNPKCSADDLMKTRDHAIRSGDWNLFMSLVQRMEEKNPDFSKTVDQVLKGTILEDENNQRRFNAQKQKEKSIDAKFRIIQQNRPTPPESCLQTNLAPDPLDQINARIESRRNNFYLWCTTQTAEFFASFISDKEAKTHVDNGIQISNSLMSSYLNPNSLFVQAGSLISLSNQINNYTAQDENMKNALWFAGMVTHGASLANEGWQMARPADPNQAASLSDVASLTTGVLGFAGPYVLKSVIGDERRFGEAEVSTTYISYWRDEAGRFVYRNAETICTLPKNFLFLANHSDLIPLSGYIQPIIMSPGAAVAGGVAAVGATGYAGYCFATRDSDPNFINHRVLGHLNNAVYNHRKGNTQEGEKCILDAYKYAQTPEQREEVIKTAKNYGIMSEALRGKLESGSEKTTTALMAPLYAYKQTVLKESEKQIGLAPVIELTKAVGLGYLLK